MINRVVLVGRLTKDVELRYTPSGVPTARFTLAVNRTFTNQSGEREADFIGCVAWRKQAENLANYMKKGSLIGIEGRIQTSNFEGQDGKKVFMTDVVADSVQFLEPRGNNGSNNSQTQNQNYQGTTQNQNYQSNAQTQNYGGNNSGNPFGNHNVNANTDPFGQQSNQYNRGPVEVNDEDLPF